MTTDPQPATAAPEMPAPAAAPAVAKPAAAATTFTPDPVAAPATAVTAPVAGEASWPEDWRDKFSDGDAALRKQLDRVSSPVQFAKNYRELERMKNEAMKPKELAADATPEQVAEYRKSIGVPETHDKYEYKLPEGFNFGESDKPHVDMYLKAMHEKNAPPSVVEAGLKAYASIIEQQAVQYVAKDHADRRAFEDEMRQEWVNDYRPNINLVSNFINGAPPEIAEMMHHGRGPDGKALLNNPGFVRWINSLSRELNPAATVVHGQNGRDSLDTINEELAKFSDMRRTQGMTAWHKNDAARARERELLGAKEKLEKRKA